MNYRIVDSTDEMAVEDIVRLLKATYWAGSRSPETIEKSVRNSACYGVLVDGAEHLAGFARVISDHATTWYLCDVVIDPAYQRRGLGKALVSHIVSLPEYAGLRGMLLTKDAHGLYEQFGFRSVEGKFMSRPPG